MYTRLWVSYETVTSQMPAPVGVVKDAFLTEEPTRQLHFKEERSCTGQEIRG